MAFAIFFCLLLIVNSTTLLDGTTVKKIFMQGYANQYLVKGYLQPSSIGTLLLLSVALYLYDKRILSIATLAAGATIHPTYLLPAAMLTTAYMIGDLRSGKSLKSAVSLGFFALLLVLPIALVTAANSMSGDAELAAQGRNIFANIREPHHAHIENWRLGHTLLQSIVLGLGIWFARRTPLLVILGVPLAIASLLMIIKQLSGSDFLALLFPHRISVLLIPVAGTMVLAKLGCVLADTRPPLNNIVLALSICLGLTVAWGGLTFARPPDSAEFFSKRGLTDDPFLFDAINSRQAHPSIYIVPPDMHWFRLDTLNPVVVDWKSHPYTAVEMVDWYERYDLVQKIYTTAGDGNQLCELIEIARHKYAASRLIFPSDQDISSCNLTSIYTGHAYNIYQLEG